MTPKERWLAVLQGEKPDRLPMDFWGTPEAKQKLQRYLGCATEMAMYQKLNIDLLISVGPEYAGPPRDAGVDMYGCLHQTVEYEGGVYEECVSHPLAPYTTIDEIDANYTWPTADWFDYSRLADTVAQYPDYPIRGGGSEPFLVYCNLRGLEQAYIDLVENREMVEHCLDRLFDFAYENTTRIYEALPGKVQLSYVAEDFGAQESLLFSPRIIRDLFIPRMKRMIDLAHENDVYVFHHSDGAIRPIIPDMIAAGIDILNPIQWRCEGMERAALKQDFGAKVVLHGGMDNQYTLPFGTVDEVWQEVRDNIELLGAGGGYILAPCHNIQAVSPPENIVAMYQAGFELGRVL